MRLACFAWRNAKRPASLGPRSAKVASLLVDLDLPNGACERGISLKESKPSLQQPSSLLTSPPMALIHAVLVVTSNHATPFMRSCPLLPRTIVDVHRVNPWPHEPTFVQFATRTPRRPVLDHPLATHATQFIIQGGLKQSSQSHGPILARQTSNVGITNCAFGGGGGRRRTSDGERGCSV